MTSTRHVTAVLLLTAFAAVACSKTDESPQAKTAPPDAAQEKPVPATGAAGQTDEEGVVPTATAPITAPSSFADGEAAYQARKYSDATVIFEAYTERRPANAWGHYMLGLSAWKSGDLSKSEK